MNPYRTTFPLAVALATAALAGLAPAGANAASKPVIPKVATGATTSITFSSAVINGEVNPEGVATVATFQWGTTRAFGSNTPVTPLGNGTTTVPFSSPITGLAPLTRYYYRIIASGPNGSATGATASFTTPAVPLSVSLATSPSPVVFGNPFYVEGTLAGTGNANHEVVLQANPFPYTAGFQTVGNPEVTNANGGFEFPFIGLQQTAQLRVTTLDNPPVVSQVATEPVAVSVTLHIGGTHRRGFDLFSGSVTPPQPAALIGYERLKPHAGFVTVAGGALGSSTGGGVSRFSQLVKVHRGVYRVYVRTAGGAQVSNVSPAISVP